MKFNRWTAVGAILSLQASSPGLRADDTAETIKALQQQIENLEKKVHALEHHRELDGEAAAEKSGNATTVSLGVWPASIAVSESPTFTQTKDTATKGNATSQKAAKATVSNGSRSIDFTCGNPDPG